MSLGAQDNQGIERVFEHDTHGEHSDCSSFWMFESHQTSSIMLEKSSIHCVNSTVRQWYSLSWNSIGAVHHYQEASILHQFVSL